MDYRESLDYLYGHTNYEAVPKPHAEDNYDLRRVFQILRQVGDPHLKAKSLHVAGTNGKGSTSAMIASVLVTAGFTTGLYTSPHLITTRERIMVNGRMISESELEDIMTRLQPKIEAVNTEAAYGRLTVFEILTLLGFVYFAENACQFQVVEVGMGGRYDATNVVRPEVCLITTISFDHTAILGHTLTQIATEKCGIIKPGCTVVTHPQQEEAMAVIQNTCREKGVNLIQVGRDVTSRSLNYNFERQEMEVQGRLDKYTVSIPLLGQFQLDNTAAVIAALELLIERGYRIAKDNILQGLARVYFPGRMNIIGREPLILVDGGHNPGAAHNLKLSVSTYFKPAKSILVVGIASDKDIAGIVGELAPIADFVIATRADSPRAARPEVIAAEFGKYGVASQISESVSQAVDAAINMAGKKDLLCITGSLYVVGEAISYLKGARQEG